MLELRRCLNLSKKTLGPECSGEIRVEHFDRDIAIVAQVVSEVDRCHAASADLTLDAVPGLKRVSQTDDDVSHDCRVSSRKESKVTAG